MYLRSRKVHSRHCTSGDMVHTTRSTEWLVFTPISAGGFTSLLSGTLIKHIPMLYE